MVVTGVCTLCLSSLALGICINCVRNERNHWIPSWCQKKGELVDGRRKLNRKSLWDPILCLCNKRKALHSCLGSAARGEVLSSVPCPPFFQSLPHRLTNCTPSLSRHCRHPSYPIFSPGHPALSAPWNHISLPGSVLTFHPFF